MPYPHGGSKVIYLHVITYIPCVPACVCVCVCVCVDVYTRVYHHMFDSADLTHANERCHRV